MRIACAVLLLAIGSPALAEEPHPLVGSWKLLSQQAVVEGQAPQETYGANPNGFLMASRDRIVVIITAPNRKPGNSDAERAALHRTMAAASGRYRIEGNTLFIRFDASWNEAWNGTEQRRLLAFEGDRMIVDAPPIESTLQPGKMMVLRLVFQREE